MSSVIKFRTVVSLGPPLSEEDKRRLLLRTADAATFKKAPRLRDFLLYVGEQALKQESANLCEASIGCAVFGRQADYSREDNIVRVSARQLRKRLEEHFENEGKAEPCVIVIPKGSYVPEFVPRTSAEPPAELPAPARSATPRASLYSATAAALLLLCACLWLAFDNRRLESQLSGAAPVRLARFPWTALFNDRQTRIVLADSCLVLLEDVIGRQLSLSEYVNRSHLELIRQYQSNPELHAALGLIAARQYTSLADVALVERIMQLAGAEKDKVALNYARNLNIRDFKTDNFILVGSSNANPWVGLFEKRMKFAFQSDFAIRRAFFRNTRPRSGEDAVYRAGGPDGRSDVSYAVIALLPNLNRTGNVLIIEGTNMEGTEAGVEFLTDPAFEQKAAHALGSVSAGSYFEILLRLRTVGGTDRDVEAVYFRPMTEVQH